MPSDPSPEPQSGRDDTGIERNGPLPHREPPNGLPSNGIDVNGTNADDHHHQRQTPPASPRISLDGNLTHIEARSTEVGNLIFPRDEPVNTGTGNQDEDGPQPRPVTSTAAGTVGHLSQGRAAEVDGRVSNSGRPDVVEVLLLYIGGAFVDDERLIRCLVQGARRRSEAEGDGRQGETAGDGNQGPVGRDGGRRRRHT